MSDELDPAAAHPGAARDSVRRAVFLDANGPWVDDAPSLGDAASLHFAPLAPGALQRLAQAGWLLVLVGQPPAEGVDGALATAPEALCEALAQRIEAEAGVRLAGFYCCPHGEHGAQPQAARCHCGTPGAGLFEAAAKALAIDLKASWVIGDRLDDVESGRRAGCKTVFVDRGHETQWRLSRWRIPDHSCGDLAQAAALILEAPGLGAA